MSVLRLRVICCACLFILLYIFGRFEVDRHISFWIFIGFGVAFEILLVRPRKNK